MLIKFLKWILSFLGIGSVSEPIPSSPGTTPEENPMPPVNGNGRKRKALIVGLNKYQMPGADLNGCVNDAEAMWERLVGSYGFEPDNIRIITDERATKQAILERLHWLVGGATPGDELFFHNSSHGSQVRDRNGDELDDGKDEILISYDHSWDAPLKDDDLYDIFKELPDGVYLTVVIDSCHSGSMTRGLPGNPGNPHDDVKPRFLPPPVDIAARSWGRKLQTRRFGAKKGGSDNQKHILLSGCRDDQTSADAVIDGEWGGALTVTLLKVLDEHREWDWNHVHAEVAKRLKDSGYTQEPQLTGLVSLKERVPFGGAK